jgi:hypothetical protein
MLFCSPANSTGLAAAIRTIGEIRLQIPLTMTADQAIFLIDLTISNSSAGLTTPNQFSFGYPNEWDKENTEVMILAKADHIRPAALSADQWIGF